MHHAYPHRVGRLRPALLTAACLVAAAACLPTASGSELRHTPLVKAVRRAQPAVVNVFGEKRLGPGPDQLGHLTQDRRVNGMGTGVIIDQRGYILTNHHVVEGVRKIKVTLADEETVTARLISFDSKTDLAVIKIEAGEELPVIPVGSSNDLMPGESVIAVGNAYGYGHTVTSGIISALNRTVQVTDTVTYEDLIQTDASINPGNSGGPLLNIDGKMIGINVAVRAGAQGIGFAIPADKAMAVAAELISARRLGHVWHGLTLEDRHDGERNAAVVVAVEEGSPAAEAGIEVGDRIERLEAMEIGLAVDFQRALLDREPEEMLAVTVDREGRPVEAALKLAALPEGADSVGDRAWDVLGLRLEPIQTSAFRRVSTRYRGGLTVTAVREGSPAARQGIRPGDVLVGMHVWETINLENIDYVLKRARKSHLDPLKFYILRDGETLYGFLPVGN